MLVSISSRQRDNIGSSELFSAIERMRYTLPISISNVKELVIESVVIPFTWYTINNGNKRIDYQTSLAFPTVLRTLNISTGLFTPTQLASEIQSKFSQAGFSSITCSYENAVFMIFRNNVFYIYNDYPTSLTISNPFPPPTFTTRVPLSTLPKSLGLGNSSLLDEYYYFMATTTKPNNFYTIDGSNNHIRISFADIGEVETSISNGTYSCQQMAASLLKALQNTNTTLTLGVSYNGTLEKFVLEANGVIVVFTQSTLLSFMGFSLPLNYTTGLYRNLYTPIPDKYILVEDANNILTIVNNDSSTTYNITIDEGSYTTENLPTVLQTAINASGLTGYTVSYSQTAKKFSIKHLTQNFTVNTGKLGTFMGYTANTSATLTNGSMTATAQNPSTLSGPNNILIHSKTISDLMENTSTSVIHTVPVNTTPFNTIVNTPNKRIKLKTPNTISSLDFGLVFENNRAVDLNGCHWSISIRFII